MEGKRVRPAGSEEEEDKREGRPRGEDVAGQGGAGHGKNGRGMARMGGAWQEGRGMAAGLTCRILQRSDRQSMSSHGWYMPSVTQFSRITSMLIHSNHVRTKSRTKQLGDRGAPPTTNTGPPHFPTGASPDGSMPTFSKTLEALEPAYPSHNRQGHMCQIHQGTQTPPSNRLPGRPHRPAPA